MNMAKRELGAFLSVVTDLYGSEEARISAEDWLEEFGTTDNLPGSTDREWRLITIGAAARLAKRLSGKASCNTCREVPDIRLFEPASKAPAAAN